MSPDFPLEFVKWLFQFGTIGFLLGMMVIYAILRGWYFYKLLSGDTEKYAKVFQEARSLIESEHWGTRYRMFLKKVLSKLTTVIGDEGSFPNEKPKKIRLKVGDAKLDEAHKQSGLQKLLGVKPFTVQSYEFCMMLALLYPIFSFIIGWVIGGVGTIGTLEILPEEPLWLKRFASLFVFLTVFISAIWSRKLSGLRSRIVFLGTLMVALILSETLSITFTITLAVAFAGSFVGAFFTVGSMTFAASLVLASSVALVGTFIFVGQIELIGALILSVVSLFITTILIKDRRSDSKILPIFWLCFCCIYLLAGIVGMSYQYNAIGTSLMLFYLILPLVNAPIDWLSLGITRGLLQSVRFKHHKFGKAIMWSCLDLMLALIALLLVSGVTVVAISLANKVSPTPILDLQALFISLGNLENWRDNLWIYFMLLSTLVPTAIHFALAGGALTLAVSDKKRKAILADMQTNDLSAKRAWAYVSVMPAFGFILAPSLLIYGLYWLLHAYGDFLGGLLIAWAKMLAALIDPNLGQVVI